MQAAVLHQVIGQLERLPTILTHVWPLVAVGALMAFEGAQLAEGGAADGTLMRFLPRVCSLVDGQATGLGEGQVAHLARERLLTCDQKTNKL